MSSTTNANTSNTGPDGHATGANGTNGGAQPSKFELARDASQPFRDKFDDGEITLAELLIRGDELAEAHGISKVRFGQWLREWAEQRTAVPPEPAAGPPPIATLPDPAASPVPKPLAVVLDQTVKLILARVVFPLPAARAVALWTAGTWGVRGPDEDDGPDRFPRLTVRSATKRCGKSLLLELVMYLCRRPISAESVTAATVFRATEAYRPTWIIDEADRFLKQNPELTGVMNSGYARHGTVLRTVETTRRQGRQSVKAHEVHRFSTFSPMAIAGIGRMVDTIEDRAIRVVLKREPAPRSRSNRIGYRGLARAREIICSSLGAYSDDLARAMAETPDDGDFPSWMDDRAADNWEPLVAVAKLAGGPWPDRVQVAMRELCQGADAEAERSEGERLLADVYEFVREQRSAAAQAFVQWRRNRQRPIAPAGGINPHRRPLRYDFIPSDLLAMSLKEKDDSPIAAARDVGNAKLMVARILRPFGIRPIQRRTGSGGRQVRGYAVTDLRPVWRSYGVR